MRPPVPIASLIDESVIREPAKREAGIKIAVINVAAIERAGMAFAVRRRFATECFESRTFYFSPRWSGA